MDIQESEAVETSTYGSELVASRIATELILEIRYLLRSLGVALDGTALMLGDNIVNSFEYYSPFKCLEEEA
jgi:hypothetical protein